jgi:hypothetical protein
VKGCHTSRHTTRNGTMKYVLMYTNRPDLDAAVPEERQAEVYQAYLWVVREAWRCHGRRRRRTAGPRDRDDCQVWAEWWRTRGCGWHSLRRRRMSEGSESSTFPTSMPRSPSSSTTPRGPRCRDRRSGSRSARTSAREGGSRTRSCRTRAGCRRSPPRTFVVVVPAHFTYRHVIPPGVVCPSGQLPSRRLGQPERSA